MRTNLAPSLRTLEMVRELGAGGMATVHLARLTERGGSRLVAVKKPHAFVAADPMTLAVLEDEARLGARIWHPNVVSFIDFIDGDEPALVMEWIDGVDLAKLVREAMKAKLRLPIDVVTAIARDMLAGLHAAHEARGENDLALDIVHRDVSPHNVLVGFDGIVRVTDFGVAKAIGRLQHTESGAIKGKLAYIAPEQLAGQCDRRADVYGVGAVVWELLTGERLRTGEGVQMVVDVLYGTISAPSVVAPDVACLDAVVMRALARRPEERFATAADMLDALESAVEIASPARVAAIVRDLLDAAQRAHAAEAAEAENAADAAELARVVEVSRKATRYELRGNESSQTVARPIPAIRRAPARSNAAEPSAKPRMLAPPIVGR